MYAHSILAAALKPDAFRFLFHPEPVVDFPEGAPVERVEMEKLAIHKDAQGVILAKKRDTKLFVDPVTGSFHITLPDETRLSGTVQTGKFGPPSFVVRLMPGDSVFGFGCATGGLVKAGSFELKTIDTIFYSIDQASYSAFPFFVVRRGSSFIGIFLNCIRPTRVEVDLEGKTRPEGPEVRFDIQSTEAVPIDVFVMSGNLRQVLAAYARITGRPFLPPLWALGYHQSRWSYRTQKRVMELAERFRALDVPCDAIHLDIHYMDKYKVFTWDKSTFPDPKGMNESLDKLGVKTVAIVDPGVALEEEYDTYESGRNEDAFCRDSMGNYFKGKVWPGTTVFPDFTLENVRKWWAHQHAVLFRNGVSGIWNDMNEPTWKMGKKTDPLLEDVHFKNHSQAEMRNLYANLEAEATNLAFEKFKKGERPFVLSRSGFSGIQKYACMWTGDNHSSWQQMKENLHMVLNLGLSGVPFSGADAGGFGSGKGMLAIIKWRRDPELFARWMELASLMPFFRAHTVLFGRDQEPWSFGESVLAICRKHIRRRYRLLPYIYNLFHEASEDGSPIVRPLFYEFPNVKDEDCEDQFLLGSSILAAPVFERKAANRRVNLPDAGEGWFDFDTGVVRDAGRHTYSTRPGMYPLLVRAGTALPMAVVGRNALDTMKSPLAFEIFPGTQISGKCILDDGISADGRNARIEVSGKKDRSGSIQLEVQVRENGFSPFQKTIRLRLPGNYRTATQKGKRIEGVPFDLTQEDRVGTAMQFEIPLENQKIEFDFRA
ncbi:MAG TPA: glycoside hydrolase family 31 protein [Leptospiraceae bacterium]|nr:hypothetical protein [Leptospirales bacterium]HMX55453.1 glycoside hydrolase family 31 protein [Leptospiraceae bacterium]HMY44278.1 glycoside hydrolase family 31 protein [Leptospiraceae bacterium]HNE22487.1 glycoside hydrolase family 31 protein [Leptospiraceae bacterium]HNJ33820.1 glycoside hydrolase family 31 protein [Leptospiraceae bacterium]